MSFHVPEKYRRHHPERPSSIVPKGGVVLFCLAVSAWKGSEWYDHVSVSVKTHNGRETKRCPSWDEMCAVKDLFWDAEDAVIQIHPPASVYVNRHPWVLHLWRRDAPDGNLPLPGQWQV